MVLHDMSCAGTCLKALREPHVRVRRAALEAVGMIAPRQRNLKPIFTDLFKGLSAAEGGDKEVCRATQAALHGH